MTKLHILVLSPHRGDAAFSLALTLAAWRKAGHAVTLLNAFTRSLSAPFSDADTIHPNDRMSYVSAMRKKEDEAFLRQIPGLALADVNIKDASLRLHIPEEEVDATPTNSADSAIEKIRHALTRHLAQPNSFLVAPLGLSPNYDHRIAREAAEPFASAFYEDAPITPANPPFPATIFPPSHSLDWKRKAILLYASQLDSESAAAILAHREGIEQLYVNESFQTQFASLNR